jgi:hypothetical protein
MINFGMADAAFWTIILQVISFILLLPVTLYLIFKGSITPALSNKKTDEKEISNPTPDWPKLKPLNCPNCGAGVPLRDQKMSCPNCETSFPVPREYEEIRLFRNEAEKKLKKATGYWNWAVFLTSPWISRGIFLLLVWLIASPVIIGLAESKGNKPSFTILSGGKFFALAVVAWLFWIFTLFLLSGIISPRTRKLLPTLEKKENIGTAENANCSQCGGAIQYARSDPATICGYCGVEIYRAQIAWKVRNSVNEIRQKASFSLIEAVSAFREAVDDLVYTPIILMFILVILPAFLFAVFYLLNLTGVMDFLDRFF